MNMSIWLLVGAILVFFMQCSFAMVETGFTRAKNAGNIMVGGLSALVGAAILGPRIDKYAKNADGSITSNAIPGHSVTLGALGVFILWFAWYGFNGAAAVDVEEMARIFGNHDRPCGGNSYLYALYMEESWDAFPNRYRELTGDEKLQEVVRVLDWGEQAILYSEVKSQDCFLGLL